MAFEGIEITEELPRVLDVDGMSRLGLTGRKCRIVGVHPDGTEEDLPRVYWVDFAAGVVRMRAVNALGEMYAVPDPENSGQSCPASVERRFSKVRVFIGGRR